MVEILHGVGQCQRVFASRQIVLPTASTGTYFMVIDSTGKQTQLTLDYLIKEGIIENGQFEELEDNIFRVESCKDNADIRDSLCVTIKNQKHRVYFVEASKEHEHHFGRCTPDGFACGLDNNDVWNKVIEGRTTSNEFVLTRSYHMDCDPDWTCGDSSEVLSSEQQNMKELGLPLSFGHVKDFARLNDEAIIGELVESQMVEKDYDKELADLSSSTERMSLSRSSRPESGELIVRDDISYSPPPATEASPEPSTPDPDCAPGTMTIEAFEKYWATNGEQILEREWRDQYGEYMTTTTTDETVGCIEDGLSCEEEPQLNSDDSYAEEWGNVWMKFATDMYYSLMNKFVAQEELAGLGSSRQNISLPHEEGLLEQRSSDGEAGEGDRAQDEALHNKRPLSLDDFGLSASDGSCSVENVLVKGHRLKKLKRESHYHKAQPFARSADALEDGPKDRRLAKYWSQRYRLFRKFDAGIQMDDEGWFSVTPEKIAEHIANRMCPRKLRKSMLTMDAFCGVGGNTIQLAMRSRAVIAVDIDPNKIAMAKHNANIYEVDKKIDFILADMAHFVPRIAPDAIFMSPPWGGPGYKDKASFDLDYMCVDIRAIFRTYQTVSPNMAFILPRNTKVDQLCELGRVEIEQNLLNKKVKTITAYYGNTICK